eukprot:2654812-Karenia_brevis.AAC.1
MVVVSVVLLTSVKVVEVDVEQCVLGCGGDLVAVVLKSLATLPQYWSPRSLFVLVVMMELVIVDEILIW